MRKKVWVNIAHSFKEAEEFDMNYYQTMARKERLETIQLLREQYFKIKGIKNEN